MAISPDRGSNEEKARSTVAIRGDDETRRARMTPTSRSWMDNASAESKQSTTGATRLRLHDLPNELLTHVIDYLATECPSEVNWNRRPDITLTGSNTLDLKTISRTSKHLRSLVLPSLFAHARLDPNQSTSFLAFVRRQNVVNHITSLVAHLSGSCSHLHPAWWFRILASIPLTTLTIASNRQLHEEWYTYLEPINSIQSFPVQASPSMEAYAKEEEQLCPPYVFAELTHTSLIDTDSWVFNMPYHALRLRQEQPTLSPAFGNASQSHLFIARPWTRLSINESSSLKAYSQYEYYLRKTPSLLASLQHYHLRQNQPSSTLFPFTALLNNLTHFTYTAIFPFHNHVETILHSVRAMPNLTHLAFKLCPEPESTVVDDELKLALGHIDVNDAWMEFDRAYNVVAHTVIYLTPVMPSNGKVGQAHGKLEEFRVDDIKMEGIRESLEEVLSQRLQEWWGYAGEGVWRRKESIGVEKVKEETAEVLGGSSGVA